MKSRRVAVVQQGIVLGMIYHSPRLTKCQRIVVEPNSIPSKFIWSRFLVGDQDLPFLQTSVNISCLPYLASGFVSTIYLPIQVSCEAPIIESAR